MTDKRLRTAAHRMLLVGGASLILAVTGCSISGAGAPTGSPVSLPPTSSPTRAVLSTDGSTAAVTPGSTVRPSPVSLEQAARDALFGGPVPVGTCFSTGCGALPRYTPRQYQEMIEEAGGIDRSIGVEMFAGSPEALVEARDRTLVGYDEEELWFVEPHNADVWAAQWGRFESLDGTDVWRREGSVTLGCD